jgi:hypothetical protein
VQPSPINEPAINLSERDCKESADFITELRRRSEEIEQNVAELVPWSELKNEPF